MPVADVVQTSRMTVDDLHLFGSTVGHVGGARSSIRPARPGGLLHENPITVEAGKELPARFALIPAQLPVPTEMVDNGIGENKRLLGGADRVFDHAASARRHSPQAAGAGHGRS